MADSSGIKAGRAYVEVGANNSELDRKLKAAESRLREFGQRATNIGRQLGLAGLAVLAPLGATVKLASDASETLNKFRQVFGGLADDAQEWAESQARAVNRSTSDIQNALATYQAFFVGMGFGQEQALGLSQQLSTLALDLASFHNIADDEAMGRFLSAMSGSSEVLDQFGINIKAAAIEQELLAQGIDKTAAQASEQEKALARLSIITRALSQQGAVGDAERTADGFANSLKGLQAAAKDVAKAIGAELLPMATEYVQKASGAARAAVDWIKANRELTGGIAATVAQAGLMAVAIGAVLVGVGKLTAAIGGLSAAVRLLAAHPIVAAFAAIAAGAVAAGVAMDRMARDAAELDDTIDATMAKGDLRRKLDQDRIARLDQLAQAERLNNNEMGEAQRLIDALQQRYGQLGLSIDQATGKIEGMAGAQRRLTEAMSEAALVELDTAIAAHRANLDELRQEAESLLDPEGVGPNVARFLTDSVGNLLGFDPLQNRLRGIGRRQDDENRAIAALNARRVALRGGDLSALAGAPGVDQGPLGANPAAVSAAADAAEELGKIDQRLARDRRTALENELADVKAIHAERRKQLDLMIAGENAREGGARPTELAALQRRRGAVDLEEQADAAAVRIRAQVEAGQRRDAFDADLDRQRAQLDVSEAEAAVRTAASTASRRAAEGELEAARERLRLLEVEQQRAQQVAAARAAFDDPEALRARLAEIDAQAERAARLPQAVAETRQRVTSSRGTFNALAVQGLLAGRNPAQEETARNTADMKERLREIGWMIRQGGGLSWGW